MQRRDFLKLSALMCGSANRLFAQDINDYKAIVVLFLAGGNDSLNMFVPSSQDSKKGYPNYYNIRNNIRVADKELELPKDRELHLTPGQNPYAMNNNLAASYTKGFYRHKDSRGKDLGYATNALMPELAHLVNRGKVAIIANCGNLIAPATKQEILAKKKPLPPFLFAHNHQQKLACNGMASKLNYSGWGGRVYDYWMDINPQSIYTMTISIDRESHLLEGEKTSPLIIGSKGPSHYWMRSTERAMHDAFMALERRDIFKKLYNALRRHSFYLQDNIIEDWELQEGIFDNVSNAYGEKLFSHPKDATLNQSAYAKASMKVLDSLSSVAKLIKIGKENGLKRQIFYIRDGGYDTHHTQAKQHAQNLRGLSLGIGDFYKALEALGMQENVTVAVISEFGRSTGNNADGSDHAWGASYCVVGGAVKGGVYGNIPDLTLGSEDDLTHKGRLIPTTSFSQYYATLLRWFGLEEKALSLILPELKNFPLKNLGCLA